MTTLSPETIKKAVELAPGIDMRLWHDNGLRLIIDGDDYGSTTIVCGDDFSGLPQWFLDALAAALVRVVDATEWDLIQRGKGVGVYDRLLEAQIYIEGQNRTENTVLACVALSDKHPEVFK